MSPLGKTKASGDAKKVNLNVGPYVLPVYIVLSAVFILYVAYGYFSGQVYRSGYLTGQQNGYDTAFNQIVERVATKCEPVGINYGNQAINVINVACLQTAPADTETAPVEANQ